MSEQEKREKIAEIYKKVDQLLENHDLPEILILALETLAENNLYISPDIIAIQVDRLKDYQKFIQIQLFHRSGIKAVLRIGEMGFMSRYIEGVNEVICGEA